MYAAGSNHSDHTLAHSQGAIISPRSAPAIRTGTSLAAPGLWVMLVVLCIWLLSAYDLLMTVMASRHGWADELNPLAVEFATSAGALTLFKFALVVPASLALASIHHERAARWAIVATLAVLVIVALRWIALCDLFTYMEAIRPPGYPVDWH